MKTPKKIDLKPVKSSAIAAVGYHEKSRTMRIQFTSGGVYDYAGVEPEQHSELLAADSIGGHFGKRIRGQHAHTKRDA